MFEEDNSWNWSKHDEEAILVYLNQGDKDSSNETNTLVVANEDGKEIDEYNDEEQVVNGSSDGNLSNLDEELPKQRMRRQPTWIRDYVNGEDLLQEEDITNFVCLQQMVQPVLKRLKRMQNG